MSTIAARKARVLVVEDEPKTAASLRLYLESAGFEVAVAASGDDGLRRAREEDPDLVLLDVMLPGLDGLSVCRALRRESGVPIIFLTAKVTEESKLSGLRIGADDYVTKPFSPREVVARVRTVLRRAQPGESSDELRRTRNIHADAESRRVAVRGRSIELTAAEFSLLAVFLRSPGRVLTRAELLERAFGTAFDGQDRSVDARVMRLRRKIESPGSTPLVSTIFGLGYRLDDPPA